MSWATRRQLWYLFLFILIFASIAFLILRPIIFREPICTDGKQNGTERGVDCGGPCSIVCTADVSTPVILWNRAFPITDGFYNLAARIENRNNDVATKKATYLFKAYDKENKLIGQREGATYIPPNVPFLIFEPQFEVGEAVISKVTFDFIEPIVWEKKKDTISILPIKVRNILFENQDIGPGLSATIFNDSIYDMNEFDVVGMVFDTDANVINVSRTHKSKLESSKSLKVNFTWPKPFTITPATYQVEVQINPFEVSF